MASIYTNLNFGNYKNNYIDSASDDGNVFKYIFIAWSTALDLSLETHEQFL
jgi:hypothetical protein